jgi:DeoR family transcriptional regulator, aga operon transcriptional repressor
MKNTPTIERRSYILKYLETNEKVDVEALSQQFGVSKVTIRKDLNYFEKRNLLIRSRGGAMKQSLISTDLSIYDRRKQNIDLKQKIGATAAAMIGAGETIILDSGTTIMEMAKQISKQTETTIITIAVDIAFRLADFPKARVIMPGGMLRRNSLSLVGEQTASALREYYCDKYFLSADGIDFERGLLTMNIEEAHLSRICIENSKQVIALIDSGKFNPKGITTIAPLSKIDMIITDSGISPEQADFMRSQNIELKIID